LYAKDLTAKIEFLLNTDTGRWILKNKDAEIPREYLASPRNGHISGVNPIILQISNSCNLKCGYCFAHDCMDGRLMNIPDGKHILDNLADNKKQKRIIFHGGEPLMNYNLIKKLVHYSNSKKYNFAFSMQTNGTLLNDNIIEFCKKNKIAPCVSLDGLDPNANAYRGNEDVFAKAYAGLAKIGRAGLEKQVISVVTNKNVGMLEQITSQFSQVGIKSVHFTPVRALNKEGFAPDSSSFALNMQKVFDKAIYSNIKVRNLEYILSTLFSPTLPNSCTLCGVYGLQPVTISINGDMYPCDMCTGLDNFYLGNISDTSIDKAMCSEKNFRNYRKPSNVRSKWHRLHGGGCPIEAYFRGDISGDDGYLKYYDKMYDYVTSKLPLLLEPKVFEKIFSNNSSYQQSSSQKA
jgi:uncharacterized protein